MIQKAIKEEILNEFREILNQKICWGELHVSDGVDSCSGTDEEAEEQHKQDLEDWLSNKLEQVQKETLLEAIERIEPMEGRSQQYKQGIIDAVSVLKKLSK